MNLSGAIKEKKLQHAFWLKIVLRVGDLSPIYI